MNARKTFVDCCTVSKISWKKLLPACQFSETAECLAFLHVPELRIFSLPQRNVFVGNLKTEQQATDSELQLEIFNESRNHWAPLLSGTGISILSKCSIATHKITQCLRDLVTIHKTNDNKLNPMALEIFICIILYLTIFLKKRGGGSQSMASVILVGVLNPRTLRTFCVFSFSKEERFFRG